MVVTQEDKITYAAYVDDSPIKHPNGVNQVSNKRESSELNDEDGFEVISEEREHRATIKIISCPIARFGCLSEVNYVDLIEHYATKMHQEALLKAIEAYVWDLHNQIDIKECQLNVNKSDDEEIFDVVKILAEGLSCLNEDNVQIHTNVVQLRSIISEQQKRIEHLTKSMEESTQILQNSRMNTDILQTEIEAVKQTISNATNLYSHDGSFIWKITDVAQKLADAVAERQTSIYSPVFCSSPTGYKMCMRLYLHGDGQARRTHLSLFFVLLRGDYDALLTWPFQHKITFCLYDQTGEQRHIIDSFRPDIKSISFQRPKSSMNIASGIPKFLPISMIQQENSAYLRDDCMFIRCIVDFGTLPKTCLSYAINLNPGLPMSIQENMIKGEIQRRSTPPATATDRSLQSSSILNDSSQK